MFSGLKELDLSFVFQDLLSKITSNSGAFASRLGVVYFNPDAKAARLDKIYTDRELDVLSYFGKAVSQVLSAAYSHLLLKPEVLKWLNSQYPESYKNMVLTYAQAAKLPMFKLFIVGHLESHKHSRGTALKSALVKLAYPIFHGATTTEEILSVAEEEFKTVMAINQSSLKRLSAKADLKNAVSVVNAMLLEEPLRVLLAIAALKGKKGKVSKFEFEESLSAVISDTGSRYTKAKLTSSLEKHSARVIPVFDKYGVTFNPTSSDGYFVIGDAEIVSGLDVASIIGGRKDDTCRE
jgi:hypothetical protein